MNSPNPDDALENNISAEMMHDEELFKKNAMEHTLKNANKPIDELLKDIMGAGFDINSENG